MNFKIEQNHLTIATEKINFFLKHDCPRLNILQQFERDFDIDHLVIKLTETTWQAVRAVLISFVLGVSRDRLSQVSAVIITLIGVSTPLGVIIVVTLGTELPIVPHLSVRNIVFLDRLIQ